MPVATDRLAAALERELGQTVTALVRREFDWWSTFPIEGVTATLADGSSLELVLKELGRAVLDDEMRAAKPTLLDEPLRELDMYRDVLADAGLGTARYYAGEAGADGESGWLLIEHVDGERLKHLGEPEAWHAAARWLADMHRTCVGRSTPRLRRFDADAFRLWLERAVALHGGPELEAIATRYEIVVARLTNLPHTLVHGEFYGSNILVAFRDGRLRICPVDWELAARGPGLLDLAALSAGGWNDGQRDRLVGAYLEAAVGGVSAERLHDLECCRLHVALQWLGWTEGWTPPRENETDWLAEAVRAAERIGIL